MVSKLAGRLQRYQKQLCLGLEAESAVSWTDSMVDLARTDAVEAADQSVEAIVAEVRLAMPL